MHRLMAPQSRASFLRIKLPSKPTGGRSQGYFPLVRIARNAHFPAAFGRFSMCARRLSDEIGVVIFIEKVMACVRKPGNKEASAPQARLEGADAFLFPMHGALISAMHDMTCYENRRSRSFPSGAHHKRKSARLPWKMRVTRSRDSGNNLAEGPCGFEGQTKIRRQKRSTALGHSLALAQNMTLRFAAFFCYPAAGAGRGGLGEAGPEKAACI